MDSWLSIPDMPQDQVPKFHNLLAINDQKYQPDYRFPGLIRSVGLVSQNANKCSIDADSVKVPPSTKIRPLVVPQAIAELRGCRSSGSRSSLQALVRRSNTSTEPEVFTTNPGASTLAQLIATGW